MVTLTRLQQAECIPWAQIIYNHLVIMTKSKVVTPAIPENIYRIMEFIEVPVRIFSANIEPEQFNWMIPTPSSVERTKVELKSWPLIDKPMMPKKLNGKAALIPMVWVVRQPLPQTHAPVRPTAQPAQRRVP